MHATRTKICRPRSAATERVAPDRPRRTGRATHLLPWLWLILLWIRPVNVSALPADSANPTNPIVRFSVIRGTNLLGAMDVELFEQEKPATVRNFLLYLQSGAYTNSFFHRCVPGFAVQGGVIRGIEAVSQQLATHFPPHAGGANELPDVPVVI